MDKVKTISVIILAYAEAENLQILLPLVKRILKMVEYECEVMVIDGPKITDNSDKICQANQAKYVNQRYPGFGGAYRTAVEEAKGDWTITLDGDGSHNPEYIPAMLAKFQEGGYDVVIGSRYIKGGSSDAGWMSVFMSKILNFIYRVFLGIPAKDISTNFRVYHTEQLKQLRLEAVHYDVLEEILVKLSILKKSHLSIGEVPIKFNERTFGKSKRQLVLFMISYLKTLFRLMTVRAKKEKSYE